MLVPLQEVASGLVEVPKPELQDAPEQVEVGALAALVACASKRVGGGSCWCSLPQETARTDSFSLKCSARGQQVSPVAADRGCAGWNSSFP